jgi:galactokinase
LGINVAISRIPNSNVISVYSLDFQKKMTAMYSDLMKSSVDWFNYPVGVVKILQKQGYKFEGMRITFTGDVPQGAGLSSSAALEIAVGFAVQTLYNLDLPGPKLAKICQQAEHEVVGVKCGIMDQYISRMGEAGKALLIDCRSLEYRLVPLPLGTAKIIITNSLVKHKLSASDYNQRVDECEEAVKIMSIKKNGKALRDFTKEDYDKYRDLLQPTVRKRAFHVISENDRVLEGEKALNAGNLKKFGELMNQSHGSLKTFYEVSSPELDWLVEAAQNTPGCYGSRLTGAGFGGCTVSIIEAAHVAEYKAKLKGYSDKFHKVPDVYESSAMQGVHVLWKK